MFVDPSGYDIRVCLEFHLKDHGKFWLSLCLELLIADIKALVEAIGAMGVSAIIPCFLGRRVLSLKAKEKPELATVNEYVDLSCLDRTKWAKHTSASLSVLLQSLKTCHEDDPTALPKKQTMCGYKHIEGTFLLNEYSNLPAIDLICLDWMHLFFPIWELES